MEGTEEVTTLLKTKFDAEDYKEILFLASHKIEATINEEGTVGTIKGTALSYGQVGYVSNSFYPQFIEAGAASEMLAKRQDSPTRDIVLRKAHQVGTEIARTSKGTLKFTDGESLTYEATLDLTDPDALSAYRKIDNGNWAACSIGYGIIDGEIVEVKDNSVDAQLLEGTPAAEVKDLVTAVKATLIDIRELSLVAHGAYGDSDVSLASIDPPSTLVYAGKQYVQAEPVSVTLEVIEENESEKPPEGSVTLSDIKAELYKKGIL